MGCAYLAPFLCSQGDNLYQCLLSTSFEEFSLREIQNIEKNHKSGFDLLYNLLDTPRSVGF